jgi:DNA-binding XRE family transcriptional regulator
MERDIRLDWELITSEARRKRKERGLTQLRLATLAKVSRATVVRFEQNRQDVQISSALRILGVLDMVGRKEEGSLFLRLDGNIEAGQVVVMFAPFFGPGGAMEPKRLTGRKEAEAFLGELHISTEVVDGALRDLEHGGDATINNVLLSPWELGRHWPVQFSAFRENGIR